MKTITLFITLCLIAYCSFGQSNKFKIAAYELSRIPKSWDSHYSYQIRNLFMRVGDNWVVNTNAIKTKYYLVYNGEKIDSITGLCCSQTPGWWYKEFDSAKNSGRFLKPEPRIPLARNYITKPFEHTDADLIKKAALLSSNVNYNQKTHLSNYIPNEKELKILLDSSKTYLTSLYRKNEGCIELFHDFIDTVISYEIDSASHISIDTANCFIDDNGNKLLNILFPTDYRWRPIYPFVGECQQEESFYYFKILCHITNAGKISFIGDNLQYLGHGDFDNDGKDEFLFWTTRHNHDGYVMYYDDFRKVTKLLWNYH